VEWNGMQWNAMGNTLGIRLNLSESFTLKDGEEMGKRNEGKGGTKKIEIGILL